MLKPVRTTAPAVLMTVADAKAHLRVDHSVDDTLIESLIAAATSYLDGYAGVLGRALVTQSWKQELRDWPLCHIRLALAPVSAVTSVKYYDENNVQQTLTAANYALIEDGRSPLIEWAHNATLPGLYDRPDAIEVIYVAGYGAASAVPGAIIVAAKMLIAHLYENREAVIVGTTAQDVPFGVSTLIAPFRRIGF